MSSKAGPQLHSGAAQSENPATPLMGRLKHGPAQVVALAAMFAACASPAFSQEPAKSHYYLQVEDLSGTEDQPCHLKKTLVMPIAVKELRTIGINAVSVPTHRYVHLSMSASAFEQSAYCTTLWVLDIKSLDLLSSGTGPVDDLRPRTKTLCRAELIGIYDRANARTGSADAIHNLVQQCSRQRGI